MGKPAPPAAPDPTATINAQSQANSQSALQTAELNRINQNTPYGNLSYSQNGTYPDGTPQYTQTTSLAPAQQNLLDMANTGAQSLGGTALGMLGQVGNSYSNPIDMSHSPGIASGVNGGNIQSSINTNGIPGMQSSVQNGGPGIQGQIDNGNYGGQIQQAQDAAYKGQTQYLDPQFQQAGKSLDNSLINQGLTQGSEAYNNAQTNFANQKQQAYGNAQLQAINAGNQEQNTLFNQASTRGNFTNAANAQGFNQGLAGAGLANSANQQAFGQNQAQAQQQNSAQQQQFGQGLSNANLQNSANAQYMQQLFALRNQPLNEYNALASGSQVTQPNFSSFAQSPVAATQSGQIINQGYQNQMSAYNASQQGINNLFSLGGSLGGAAILASDRRLKREIKRVSTTPGGIPIYSYRYNDNDADIHYGVMADEILPIIPEAVLVGEDGYYRVDYGKVL